MNKFYIYHPHCMNLMCQWQWRHCNTDKTDQASITSKWCCPGTCIPTVYCMIVADAGSAWCTVDIASVTFWVNVHLEEVLYLDMSCCTINEYLDNKRNYNQLKCMKCLIPALCEPSYIRSSGPTLPLRWCINLVGMQAIALNTSMDSHPMRWGPELAI